VGHLNTVKRVVLQANIEEFLSLRNDKFHINCNVVNRIAVGPKIQNLER